MKTKTHWPSVSTFGTMPETVPKATLYVLENADYSPKLG
jgi:hypothetical protein